ncbi:histone H3.v1-like [Crassostrea angulata]|uniref:histone H3.v1-like n=1 Tax=Magallana angulata TaxID=2784310 RepID=UPI0022B0B544|nr:histone H3.v1-like [Crassostrea angulata]
MATTYHRRDDKQTPVDLANSMTDMLTCNTESGEKDDDKEECTDEGDDIVKQRRRRQGRSGKNVSSSSSLSSSSSSLKEMATTDHRRGDKQTPVDLANSMTDMLTCNTESGEKDDDKEECTEEGDDIVKQRRRQGRSGKNVSSSSSSSLSSSSSSLKEMAFTDHRRDDKQTPVDLANSMTDMLTCNTESGEKDDDKEEYTEEGDDIGKYAVAGLYSRNTVCI